MHSGVKRCQQIMSVSANVIETSPENTFSWPPNYWGGGEMNRHDLKDSFFSHFSQNSLGRLLTAKERDTARSVFLGLGLDKDGVITRAECRQAQQSWFHKLNKDCQSCNVR